MQHWFPLLQAGKSETSSVSPISKFGGQPTGFPAEEWPICSECGRPMQFLAQIRHDLPAVDLGAEGNILFAFKCDFSSICEFWDPDSGANFVTLKSKSELGIEPTPYPLHLSTEKLPEDEATELLELVLTGWESFEDPIQSENLPLYYDIAAFWAMDDAVATPFDFDHCKNNKAGVLPYWAANGPSERLQNTRVLLQITGDMMPVTNRLSAGDILKKQPEASRIWERQTRVPDFYTEGQQHYCNWANFCSDGIGYFFREETPDGLRYGLEILR